ncbi:hypothetical protein K439DRAFT_1241724, partial [Ramaria rubella]
NGHHSHETPDILDVVFQHKVLLYCLLPHTMHKLQPLDVGVFGPLQTVWSKHMQQRALQCHTVTWDTVVHEYMEVHKHYFTPNAIMSVFRWSGMWPVNP